MNSLYEIPDISDHAKSLLKEIDDSRVSRVNRDDKHKVFADLYQNEKNINSLECVYGYNRSKLADKKISYVELKHYKHVHIHINEQSVASFTDTLFVECVILVSNIQLLDNLHKQGCQYKDCTLERFIDSEIIAHKLDSGDLNGKITF